jgi:hypothetical protein
MTPDVPTEGGTSAAPSPPRPPEQAGLPAYGGNRRVKGLRREEVAMLSGVSVDYYIRMERGSLAGASESVLNALAAALRLDEAERTHLLARESGAHGRAPRRTAPTTVRPVVQQVLDAMTDAPAWVRNGRHDIVAMNPLARALYSPVLAAPRRPANTTRFVYLHPEEAREFFVDYDRIASDAAALLRLEAGRNPHDKALIELVGELSTRSETFRRRWASHDVKFHRSGQKRLRHPPSASSTWTSSRWSSPPRRASSSTSTRRRRHPDCRRAPAAGVVGCLAGRPPHGGCRNVRELTADASQGGRPSSPRRDIQRHSPGTRHVIWGRDVVPRMTSCGGSATSFGSRAGSSSRSMTP